MMIFIGIWLVIGILMMFFMGWAITDEEFEDAANEEYARMKVPVPVWLHQTLCWIFVLAQPLIWPWMIYMFLQENE